MKDLPSPTQFLILNTSEVILGHGVSQPILVVGLPGAVQGLGQVLLINKEAQVETQAKIDGSFMTFISAKGGDELNIRFKSSEPVQFTIRKIGAESICVSPEAIEGIPVIVRKDLNSVLIHGKTEMYGDIITINQNTGKIQVTPILDDYTFQISAEALPGDSLTVAKDCSPILSASWHLVAP